MAWIRRWDYAQPVMNSALILILLSTAVLRAQTEEAVRVGNKHRTVADIERMIIEHAKRQKIAFDFDGTPRQFVRYTNSPVAASMFCKHPADGTFFSGQVEHNGAVSCDLTAPLTPSRTNLTVRLGSKRKTLGQIERLVIQYAQQQKSRFDFKGADREFSITTRAPGTICMSFRQRGEWHYYSASVDWRGKVRGEVMPICGGTR